MIAIYRNDMASPSEKTLDRIFYALSDASRRRMLHDLARGDWQVKELANSFSFSKAATSKHLAVLENAGLIRKSRQGRDVLCSLNPRSLQSVEAWVRCYRQFWSVQMDALDKFVSTNPKKERKGGKSHG